MNEMIIFCFKKLLQTPDQKIVFSSGNDKSFLFFLYSIPILVFSFTYIQIQMAKIYNNALRDNSVAFLLLETISN